jgi:hypothetical protein
MIPTRFRGALSKEAGFETRPCKSQDSGRPYAAAASIALSFSAG